MKPYKGTFATTAAFGVPGSWAAGRHTGIDYGLPVGTPLYPAMPGKVVYRGYDSSYGNRVVVASTLNGANIQWSLNHMRSAAKVSVGTKVTMSTLMGYSGNTGNVRPVPTKSRPNNGQHLHFEVRKYPYGYYNYVSPAGVINWKDKSAPANTNKQDPKAYFMGATGPHVTWLGERLVIHGFGKEYAFGPGPTFGASDKANVKAFQKAQGYTGSDADGYPGTATLQLLAKDPVKTESKPTPEPEPLKVYDQMDPKSYFLGVKGAHVLWLGERLIAHGFGKHYTDGKPNLTYSGAERSNVEDFQKAQGFAGVGADGFPGIITLQLLAKEPVKVVKPVPIVGIPVSNPATKTFSLMSWNIAHNNAYGIQIWGVRKAKLVAKVLEKSPDVFCTQENTAKVLKAEGRGYLDANLKGYKRIAGGQGRYIYAKTSTVKKIAGGFFDLQPRYLGDDKQAAWAAVEIAGEKYLITSFHLENEGTSDTTRIAQMKHCFKQGSAMAAKHKVPADNIIHAGDTNFKTQAAINVIERDTGAADTFDTAIKQIDKAIKSFNGWRRTGKGFRIDRIWGSRKLLVLEADQITSVFNLSDHNPLIVVFGKR